MRKQLKLPDGFVEFIIYWFESAGEYLITLLVLTRNDDFPLKGSVQRKLGWVKNSANRWVLAWDYGAGHYFEFLLRCRLLLNIFMFPVSTAKLIGDFYNNRRSTANSCLRFAYSFVSLMLCQYYLSCDTYSANR